MKHGWARRAATMVAVATLPAAAPSGSADSSTFVVVAQPIDSQAVLIARPYHAFFNFNVRPPSAVALGDAVPIASQFGAKASFDRGLVLYNSPERPGVYCDLLRSSGLGLSTACLRDTNNDRKFDQVIKLGFDSTASDVLLIRPNGKIEGARFKGQPVSLPRPIPYVPAAPTAQMTGKLALQWAPWPGEGGKKANAGIWISTPDNPSDTVGVAADQIVFPRQRAPFDADLYGIKLRILGFDEKGGMRYSVRGMTPGASIPLGFVGSRLVIIGY